MVQSLAEQVDAGGRGTLWIGTRGGLASFDGERFRREDAAGPYPGGSILCLRAAAPPGGPRELWVGTTGGLLLGKNGAWRRWGEREGLRNPSVQALHLDVDASGRRTLWIGTDDQVVPIKFVRDTYDALQEQGFPSKLTELKRHTHSFAERGNEVVEKAWEFLARFHLPRDPVYQPYKFGRNGM